jgi:alpha-tubulin suppressor-like RCC1 family protein
MVSVFGRAGRRGAVWLILCLGMMLAAGGAMASVASATPGVAGWGNGADGELGNGTNHNASTFAPVSELTNASSLAAGGNFGLALISGGTVMSWGGDEGGQLGIGSTGGESQVPVAVPMLAGVSAVSAGGEDALALLSDGTVMAWGASGVDVTGSSKPKEVAGITDAVAIAAGSEDRKSVGNGADYLALLAGGEVVAWGEGEEGQLGDGTTISSPSPVPVRDLGEVTAIAAGDGQNLALLANGTVMAWGENNDGQLGDGNTKNKDEPAPVEGLGDVIAISAGDGDSLALLADGTVMAWGDDSEGELGRSTAEGNSDVPVPVSDLSGVTAISAGTASGIDINSVHNVALLDDGAVMAWGGNKEGQLGDGTEGGSSFTPIEVSGLSDVTGIAAGASDSFVVGPPVPVVTGVEPVSGMAGTAVRVTGVNLGGAASVGFGSISTAAIEEDTDISLLAIAPAEKPRTVPVTVTTAFGTSGLASKASFRYVPEGTLEFGRCFSAGKHKGDYKKGCTELATGGGYEWSPELLEPGFTLSGKGPELTGPNGALIVCDGSTSGSGEYSGGKSVADLTITFTGCGVSKSKHATKCNSPGAPAGDIETSPLEGAVGFTSRELDNVALEFLPALEGEPFLTFICGSTTTEMRGEVLAAFSRVNSSTSKFKVDFAGSRGKQHIEGFEKGPTEVLEASVAGGPFEQVELSDDVTLTSEEPVELDSAV